MEVGGLGVTWGEEGLALGASPPPHLHLLQLAVVRTPEDHPPIAAASGHQRPVPQGAEPKHTAIVGAGHHLCDAVSTCGMARGKGQHGEVSPVLTPESTSNSQSFIYPPFHPPTHLFKYPVIHPLNHLN